ncbi:MAG TPA: polysaccharide deacetylase family protein [Terriglobales bacterium]|nr:polysaccharide deacetylase family protein [Terriglobales bacterium]
MRLVSPLLKHVVYPSLSKAGYLRRAAGTTPAVLTYHGVFPAGYKIVDPRLDGSLVSADLFRRQLRFLKDQYNVISPEEFLLWCEAGHELPPRSVLLTCDDGLRNSLFDMLPILQDAGLTCLFFVTGASLANTPTMLWYEELYLIFLAGPENFTLELLEIGLHADTSRQEKRSLWWELVRKLSRYSVDRRRAFLERIRMQLGLSERWDAEYREDPLLSRRFLVLNRAELQQLAAAGMCIGGHTLSHPMLSQLSPELAWSEISESKHNLEQALGRKISALAYPFGDSSSVASREIQMAERAGFQCAFLNVGGGFGTQTPKFALPRVHVTAEMTIAEFEAHISGFHRSLQELFRPTSLSAAVGSNA